MKKKNLLFICSSNTDRSPALEALFRNSSHFNATSCGVGPFSHNKPSSATITWSDYIFVMDETNERHKTLLLEQVPKAIEKPISILNISNDHTRNSPKLLELVKIKMIKWLEDNNLGQDVTEKALHIDLVY